MADMVTCPQCGGEAYDNRQDPNRGKRPLIKCPECNYVLWPPKGSKGGQGPRSDAPPPRSQGPTGPAPENTPAPARPKVRKWSQLLATYERASKCAIEVFGPEIQQDFPAWQAATFSLAKMALDAGLVVTPPPSPAEQARKAEQAAKEQAERTRRVAEERARQAGSQGFEDFPPALGEGDDDDLPF